MSLLSRMPDHLRPGATPKPRPPMTPRIPVVKIDPAKRGAEGVLKLEMVQHSPGRPLTYTKEIGDYICNLIRRGAFIGVACRAAGVNSTTFRTWLKRDEPEFKAFIRAFRQAEAEARSDAEARVFAENPEFWLMKGPGRKPVDEFDPGWASTTIVNVKGTIVASQGLEPGEIDLTKLTTAELDALDGILAKALPAHVPSDE